MAFPVRSGWVLVATLAAHSLASGQEQPTQPFDIVIRGGKIVDGTGNPWFIGDVAIRGDRIEAVGAVATETTARRVIDARGMVVAPGFIDMHSHSDMTLLEDGSAESKIRQGVTTEILGEDTSAGPAKGKQPPRSDEARRRHAYLDDPGRLLRYARASGHRRQRRQLRRAGHAARMRARRLRSTVRTPRASTR